MLRIVKPKTKRARRELEKRAPKLDENAKKVMLLNGTKTSSVVKGLIADLHHLKKSGGHAVRFSRKNDSVRPFEGGGETSLEFLARKTDCSLFAFGSHSKKRPDNLVLGRMFDHHLYDMVELGVQRFLSMDAHGGGRKSAPQVGSKPCFAFLGEGFESRPELRHLREVLLDFFRGEVVEAINVAGLDRVFVCAAAGEKVYLRHCAVELRKPEEEAAGAPRVHLVDVGPSVEFVVRRHRLPSDDLRREATKSAPKSTKKKVKNVQGDSLAGKVGRIYMPKQEVGGMALAKMKGLKRERRAHAAEVAAGDKPVQNVKRVKQSTPVQSE